MCKSLVLAGLFLLLAGSALAQDFPKVETSPAFMYIRTSPNFTNAFNGQTFTGNSFNCVGGGGTLAYNFTSMIGLAADLGGCKILANRDAVGDTIDGNQFTFLFGPRITLRRNSPSSRFSISTSAGTASRCPARALRLLASTLLAPIPTPRALSP